MVIPSGTVLYYYMHGRHELAYKLTCSSSLEIGTIEMGGLRYGIQQIPDWGSQPV